MSPLQSKRISVAAEEDERIRRRTLQQIGTPRAGEELAALKCALKGRDVLAALSARLPLQIGNLANDQLEECRTLIESTAARDGDYSVCVVDRHEPHDGAMAIDPARCQGGWQRHRCARCRNPLRRGRKHRAGGT